MEIDTGASYSVIAGATHKQLCPQERLMPTNVMLQTYSGKKLELKGSMMACVRNGDIEAR